jgi:hypothetical protein
MKIDRTSASDTLFRELPFYEPMLEGSSDGNPFSLAQPPILPVSKYVTGKLVSQIRGPPRKRSRYDYDSEDEPSTPPSRSGTSAEHSMPSTPGRRLFCRNDLPPEMNDVALFNTDNKHVRDRLQAAHSFRPPTEFNMPTVAFFENRIPSQWLWEEDQKLRALVKEFTFNWSLVSQQLALPSMFVSGSGRRTPWECDGLAWKDYPRRCPRHSISVPTRDVWSRPTRPCSLNIKLSNNSSRDSREPLDSREEDLPLFRFEWREGEKTDISPSSTACVSWRGSASLLRTSKPNLRRLLPCVKRTNQQRPKPTFIPLKNSVV